MSTDHAFQASGIKAKRNLKALLIKKIDSLCGGAVREILGIINENLDRSYNVLAKTWCD